MLLLAPLVALIAVACWFVLSPRVGPNPPPTVGAIPGTGTGTATPTSRQLAALRAQALNACRCARRLPHGDGGRGACWGEFNRAISQFSYSAGGTLCGPMSTEEICFEGECVVQSYGGGACSQDEARVLQAIVDEDFMQNPERFESRMDHAVQAFVRGERIEAPHGAQPGCTD
jgi:hypothetical protein